MDDDHAVGVLHRRKPVGDHQHRPVLHQLTERLLDQELALGVEVGGRLVQDQNGRVLQKRAGDGEALALPARELDPALAHGRRVALGQHRHELMDLRHPGGVLDVGLGGAGPAVADVVADGVGEEESLLGDDAHERPERGHGDFPDVAAVYFDAPGLDVVKARHEVHEGRLTRSRHADEGDHLPFAHGEGNVGERILLGLGVPEGHALEDEAVVEVPNRFRAGAIGDGRGRVEDLEDTLDGGARLLDGVHHAPELAHRPVQENDGRREGEELAGRQRPADDPVPAVPDGAHDPQRPQHLHEGLGQLVDAVVLEGESQEAVVDAVEAVLLEALAAEGLDDLVPGEGLLQNDVELAHLFLRALPDLVELAADGTEQHADGGEDEDGDQRQYPLAKEHDGEEGGNGADLAHAHHEHRGRQPRQAVHVVDDTGHQLRRMDLRVEGQRHALDMAVELPPDAGDHALADGRHQVGLPVAPKPLDDVGAEEHEGKDLEHEEVALDEDVVQRGLDEPGDETLAGRHHQGHGAAQDEQGQVGPEIRPQPQEQAVPGFRGHQAGRLAASRRR